MKYWALFLILLLSTVAVAQKNEEFRATWVIDFQWMQAGNSIEQNKALIREVLDNHQRANMTSVLWQVRRWGTVLYPSSIEPWGPQANFSDPGFDPLAYAIEEAHARGLELHAWFNTFECRNAYSGTIANINPNWVCRDEDGISMPAGLEWVSPGMPAVRQHLLNVALEIVNNYDIDGLHMDFVRWNEHTNDGDALALADANEQLGMPDGYISEAQMLAMIENASGRYLYDVDHPLSGGIPAGYGSWEEYWRGSVTALVKSIHDSIQVVKPYVRLSPAALGRYNWGGWQGYGSVHQDAAHWLNEGYIDQLTGMHYHWSSAGNIYSILEGGCPQCWSQYIQPAIQTGRLYSVGLFSDSWSTSNLFGRHPSVVDTVRSIPWADGFQFFSYSSWDNELYWDVAENSFFKGKAKIRATEIYDNTAPSLPNFTGLKVDSLNYTLSVSPVSGTVENPWFAIYRSEDAILNVDTDEIVDVKYSSGAFDFTDSFDGLQDFDGSYTYFATAFDRYWNESDISNTFTSDPIPSLAPTVVASVPAANDTIPVSSNPGITFSKTIDISTVTSSTVTFSPAVTIANFLWASDNKSVVLDIDGSFSFATDYTLTISAGVTDVNGKAIDGDGNGSGGDPFILNFRTLDQDNAGPVITYSYPDLTTPQQDVYVDDILTVVFDEYIDPATVGANTITVQQNGSDVPAAYAVSDVAQGFSIISIQPDDPFDANADYNLQVAADITDTLGNITTAAVDVDFRTGLLRNEEVMSIENFTFPGDWWQPGGSGSTVGIIVNGTTFGFQSNVALPATGPRKAAAMNYQWDETAGTWLIREYLNGGPPRNVLFDTTYTLQCYIFGDGSGNKFRFALDDQAPNGGATNHEVSEWTTIDWHGWKLVSWDLGSDPVGSWIGNGVLEGNLRIDSFQFTHEPGAASSGRLYFDDLRVVKTTTSPVAIEPRDVNQLPETMALYQNYPNPFNPETTINFDIATAGRVKLAVYDVLGREVRVLADGPMNAGSYRVTFDGSKLSSGVYIYRLTSGKKAISKRLMLVK